MNIVTYSQELPLGKIKISPFHVRKVSASERVDDLAASIKQHGLIHAVSVVKDPSGKDEFELTNGHRRLKAHEKGNIPTIRANVYEYDEDELKDESLRRERVRSFLMAANSAEPLIPIERARAYQDFADTLGWDTKAIAKAMHVTEEAVVDDLMLLNISPDALDVVQAHHNSFTQETLRVLARYATPGASKAWVMSAEEQLSVVKEIAFQHDKRLVESARFLESHIKEIVNSRRAKVAANRRKAGRGGDDPVKVLFKMIEGVKDAASDLTEADFSSIKEIDPTDKGKATDEIYGVAQQLIDFVDETVQKLKTKRPSRVA